MNPPKKPVLSIVVPVFNEAETVRLFWDRMKAVLRSCEERCDFEIIFTNNRSTDTTLEVIRALRAEEPRIQVLTFSRNVGYQSSVYAGLRQASGDLIAVIDVDCEDPPELLPTFLAGVDEGHDIVYGLRDRRAEPALVTGARKLFYRLNRLVADSDIVLDMAEFMVMKSHVRDVVVARVGTFPFLRAEIAHYGFSRKGIPYDRQKRVAGTTHYHLLGMTRFAIAGILSSTTLPLRLTAYMAPVVFLVDAALFVLDRLGHTWAFPSLVTASLLFLVFGTASIALYQARTYRNVIGRPLAVVDWSRSSTNTPPEKSPNAVPPLWDRP